MAKSIERVFNIQDYTLNSLRITESSRTLFTSVNGSYLNSARNNNLAPYYSGNVEYSLSSSEMFGEGANQGFMEYWSVVLKNGTLPFRIATDSTSPLDLELPQGQYKAQASGTLEITFENSNWLIRFDIVLYSNTPKIMTRIDNSEVLSVTSNAQELEGLLDIQAIAEYTMSYGETTGVGESIENLSV